MDGSSIRGERRPGPLSIVCARAAAAAAPASTGAARVADAGHKAGAKHAAPARQRRRSAVPASAGQDGSPVRAQMIWAWASAVAKGRASRRGKGKLPFRANNSAQACERGRRRGRGGDGSVTARGSCAMRSFCLGRKKGGGCLVE